MASSFFGLDIALSGLYTSQAQLNTVSHNIANAETEGYSKQSVATEAGTPLSNYSKAGMTGTGVVATEIYQTRSLYYDEKYWKSNSMNGEYGSINDYLTSIENYLNETSDSGFTTIFDNFYNSISSLNNDASSLEKRTSVSQLAETFTAYLNNTYDNLQNVQNDLNIEVKNQVDKINSIGNEIATLNKQINTLEVSGKVANDLRDQRALLVDELSAICTVEVDERELNKSDTSVGIKNYTVRINGQTLVNGEKYNALECVPREKIEDQNDIEGLYDIRFVTTKDELNLMGSTQNGTLSALVKLRDGNNKENLTGKVTANAGDTTLTITNTNINDIAKMNMPSEGSVTIGGSEYEYSGFSINVIDNNGQTTYEYTFNLKTSVDKNIDNKKATIGESIAFKGVRHYMSELNEFLRTFTNEYNELCNSGEDLNGDVGKDFFMYNDVITGEQTQLIEKTGITTFSSLDSSYYNMTAGNVSINREIMDDARLMVTGTDTDKGIENSDIIARILELKSDETMFNQGEPAAFLQSIVAEIGVDKSNYKKLSENQDNITKTINKQRLSISSVDLDEEGMDLLKFQKAYELSAKVMSVMNEVYDKLINEMGL